MSSIFDILGPVMVGPSSSHTAGAVRIGYTARQLFGEPVKKADSISSWFICSNRRRTWDRQGDHRRSSWDEAG